MSDRFDRIFAIHGGIAALSELNGVSFDPEAIFAKVLAEINGVHQISDESRLLIKKLWEHYGQMNVSLGQWMNDATKRAEGVAAAEAQRNYHELKLPAAQSSIYVLSTLIGLDNPERGRKIAVAGGAAMQVASSLSRFQESAAWISKLDQAKQNRAMTMSAAVMTGDLVGAALQVVSLFGKTGPSAEAMILQELQKISRQIEQVRTEMHERFDRVDVALNEIYSKMGESFAKVDWTLGQISGDVRDVQVVLLDVQQKLTRLEGNMYAFLDTASRMDLLAAVNGNLGYARRTGLSMPYASAFVNAENDLQSWVTIHSRDSLRAGIPRSSANDILADLDAFPLHYNINNLRVYPNLAFGLPALHGERLANPLDGLFGAQAWMTLMDENPQHARRIGSFRRDDIRQTLSRIQTALTNIRNPALIAALILDYRAHANAIAPEIEKIENDYRNTPGNSTLSGVDLWGSARQPIGFVMPSGPVESCSGPPRSLSGYTDLGMLEVPAGFVLAAKLGLGSLSVCVRAIEYLPCEDCDYDWFIYMDTRYNGQTVQSRGGHAGTFYWGWEREADFLNCLQYYISLCHSWEDQGWKSRVTLYPLIPPDEQTQLARTQLLRQAETSVEAVLRSAQMGVYAQTLTTLNSTSSLAAVAKQISLRKLVLLSYVALGMPRSFAEDDYLRALLSSKRDSLLDTDGVRTLYMDALAKLLAAETVPKVNVSALANARADALHAAVGRTLSGIATGDLVEGHQFIDSALTRLDVAAAAALAPSCDDGPYSDLGDDDGDGIVNSCDNCRVVANPTQLDSDGDGIGNLCDADLNDDGFANALDLGLLKGRFGGTDSDADLNGDGRVNSLDLGRFKALFGKPPGPSGVVEWRRRNP